MKPIKYRSSPIVACILSASLLLATHLSAKAQERIISAGGSITEILYGLKLDNLLVGVDNTSLYPPEAKTKPKVGYFRSLSAEGLLSLEPTTIIAAKGTGPQVVLDQLKAIGIKIKTYEQEHYTLNGWQRLVTQIGAEFGRQSEAAQLIHKVTSGIKQQQALDLPSSKPFNAIVLLSIGQRGPVAAGQNTVPNLLFKLAGINNLATGLDGYKPFNTEILAGQNLDLVLVPSHVADSLGGKQAICENQVLKLAMPDGCNVHIMDGLLLMGFGTRLDVAVSKIMALKNQP